METFILKNVVILIYYYVLLTSHIAPWDTPMDFSNPDQELEQDFAGAV